jgi:histidyl-tRNA synthetase
MAKVTASVPQGTRDFNAATVRKRNYIFTTIKSVFELYGFAPLETPAMENLDTLMGKYGDEGDKLIFKILNNGLDNEAKHQQAKADFETILQGKNNKGITERALKYDLTIPFARYVAMNYGQLTLPFKRYQIQPVWRADRPQKGRYREFYQCDADVVGSNSLQNEIELVHIYQTVFAKLQIDITIKLNNRKILAALAELCGGAEYLTNITVAIDKLDKIGMEKVKEELVAKGLNHEQIGTVENYLQINGSNAEKLLKISALLQQSEQGKQGILEIETVLNHPLYTKQNIEIDFTLARGLNYYTGIIFEIKANNVAMGSIGGGGRYDNLTGTFGLPNVPGVGISFGVDRIYDVMETLQVFPTTINNSIKLLFFNVGEAESQAAFALMQQLRNSGIGAEMYHETAKMDKQFKYAEKKEIPYAVIIGSNELAQQTCVLKNLATGEQQTIAQAVLAEQIF